VNTDEYEISIGREVRICRRLIKSLGKEIHGFESRYGMDTRSFLQGAGAGKFSADDDQLSNWRKAWLELEFWKNTLDEYETVLADLKRE